MYEVGIWGPNVVRPWGEDRCASAFPETTSSVDMSLPLTLVKKGNTTPKIRSCSHGDFWIFNSASVERFEEEMAAFSPYRFAVISGDTEE